MEKTKQKQTQNQKRNSKAKAKHKSIQQKHHMQKRTAKNELENKNKHKCKKPKQRRTKRNTSCAFRSLAAQVLRHRRLFFTQKSIKKIIKNQHLFLSFLIAFGTHLGAIWEAKIDPRWAKLGSRRLLKRYFLKNVNFHETL